jgi:hypothetical protein
VIVTWARGAKTKGRRLACFFSSYPDAFIDRPHCRDAQRMAIQTPFAKKVAGSLELQRLLLTRALTVIASSPPPPGSAPARLLLLLANFGKTVPANTEELEQSHPPTFMGPS